jgi:hypothetical protein
VVVLRKDGVWMLDEAATEARRTELRVARM